MAKVGGNKKGNSDMITPKITENVKEDAHIIRMFAAEVAGPVVIPSLLLKDIMLLLFRTRPPWSNPEFILV